MTDQFEFSIDNIIWSEERGFIVKAMPPFDSEFFPPYHLRNFQIHPELLEEEYFQAIKQSHRSPYNDSPGFVTPDAFTGSVVQGAYYSVPKDRVKQLHLNENREQMIITRQNDFFKEGIKESPYNDLSFFNQDIKPANEGYAQLSGDEDKHKSTYIYCFNVGQGDSMLLITSSKNAYLIDTNLYNEKSAKNFIKRINEILKRHEIERIKGLLITHKHIDHIRGARYFIKHFDARIDNFLINLDYSHPTKAVSELLAAAKSIPNHININRTGKIFEGKTIICIKNPDQITSTKIGAPDINDSSVSLCIRHGRNLAYLTGDLSKQYIISKHQCSKLVCHNESFLKVAHHGSITGTDTACLNLLTPTLAYISAGTSKNYNHPHAGIVGLLESYLPNPLFISNRDGVKTYELTGQGINVF